MSDPYVAATPGALITAENINLMQSKIRDDIAKQTKDAVNGLKSVPHADNADTLEHTSKSDLIKEIVAKAVAEVRANSGYMQLFKVLKVGKENVIHHNLHLCPLVDLYQLDYFPVVCSEDNQTYGTWTTFYLHHSDEKRLRLEKTGAFLEIQTPEAFRARFSDLLQRYKVQYTDDSSLSDVENDFWEAFFQDPNDPFDDNQYCHSPWFQKCCREEKSVRDAKRNGDWDDLWVQFRPRKTVNFPVTVAPPPGQPAVKPVTPAPTQIQVVQYDQDKLGLTLLDYPLLPREPLLELPVGKITDFIPDFPIEIKLMVLLKV
jgi:hypothetical protein